MDYLLTVIQSSDLFELKISNILEMMNDVNAGISISFDDSFELVLGSIFTSVMKLIFSLDLGMGGSDVWQFYRISFILKFYELNQMIRM